MSDPNAPYPVPDPEACDIEVDGDFIRQCMFKAKFGHELTVFEVMKLPQELRVSVVDQIVLSCVDDATAAIFHIETTRHERVPLFWIHDAWVVALETLKNLVACQFHFACVVLDSVYRLGPKLAGKNRHLDDAISEISYVVRTQLCESHAKIILDTSADALGALKKPVLERDSFGLAPGPPIDGMPLAHEAWKKLYGPDKYPRPKKPVLASL